MISSDSNLVVVGAGFFGLTIAHQVATKLGLKVTIIERRNHVGGNAHSILDPDTGIESHVYGSHLFHCTSEEIWRYVNGFTPFTDYRHRVLSLHKNKVYPMPINLGTICSFFGRAFTPSEARALISEQSQQKTAATAQNFEDKAIALVGRPLYEAFIRGYTAKQWQTDPRQLPADVITRLPVRFNFNSRYFDDRFEGLPSEGYFTIFKRMIDHPNIMVLLETDFFSVREMLPPGIPTIYTGPIDRYFDYRLGALAWRTLDFEREVVPVEDYQGTSVMNYADEDVRHTRIHEFRHLYPERNYPKDKTVIYREYSRFAGPQDEPFYPLSTVQDKNIYAGYKNLARQKENVIFGGRLGSYHYLDMHQAIGAALKLFKSRLVPYFTAQRSFESTAMDEAVSTK
jgi:UDP-galactopyranose mutase